jgi:hypothetical protein
VATRPKAERIHGLMMSHYHTLIYTIFRD